MSNYSVVRTVDKSGRVSVPAAFREMLGIGLSDQVEIYIVNNDLVIRKKEKESDLQEPKEEVAE